MPTIHASLCGLYPKLVELPSTPHLKRSLHAFDAGTIDGEQLELVLQANTRQILREQREAGITLFCDGLIRWDDFYSPFSTAWKGLTRGTLKRIFDTNTLQRKPHVTGSIEYRPSTAPNDAAYALEQLPAGTPLKATLPGPFTFAGDCEDEHYHDTKTLLSAITAALNQELRAYDAKKIPFVEIYDPRLHFETIDADLVRETYERLLAGVAHTNVILGSFYGTPRAEYLRALTKTALAGYSIDLVTSPESIDRIPAGASIIQLGIFDARTTADDDVERAGNFLGKVRGRHPDATLWLSLNNSTEFLPRDRALKKIRRLTNLLR